MFDLLGAALEPRDPGDRALPRLLALVQQRRQEERVRGVIQKRVLDRLVGHVQLGLRDERDLAHQLVEPAHHDAGAGRAQPKLLACLEVGQGVGGGRGVVAVFAFYRL